MKLIPGHVIISNAGRDKGHYFILVALDEKSEYIYLVDGNLRKIENPKKKKLKHVIITDRIIKKFEDKLINGKPLQNAEIMKELKKQFEED
ncbi:MAG: KOW domain-containing RNA-binding protein [Clostridiales bacterium]|nr:KOW domain-containing RNA-binding protein [Clostridiales bacterium]